jgi:tetratricopeptide (TPR) repeat protein
MIAAGAAAQSDVRVSSAAKRVVNPFAAKREVDAPVEAQPPAPIPPAETAGPKTYQNPFAGKSHSPRFVTPRLQPGPMSRWHRAGEPPVSPSDPRPVHAVLQDSEIRGQQLDLSGPLAVQEQRTALFSVPKAEAVIDASTPPDPARFGSQLAQPIWLVPDESQQAAAREEVAKSFEQERAVAQSPIDPFERGELEEVVVSDDAPKSPNPEQSVAAVGPIAEPTIPQPDKPKPKVEQPVAAGPDFPKPGPAEPIVAAPPKPQPLAKPPAPPTAEELYGQAERAAAEAASTNELAAVVQLCQRGLECRPNAGLTSALRGLAAWACNRSGEIESDRRREDAAIKAFELAIQWDPNCWLALHNRAVSRAQQGDLAGALADFNRALQHNPGLAVAYRNRGELLAATGRTEEAASDYTAALAQLPQDAELYAMRGEANHRLGKYDEALADLSQSIEIAPHNAVAYAQRGNVHAEQGDYERAISDFRQALTIDADSAEAHRSLAWLLATCPDHTFRNPRQALASASRAAQLAAPGDPFMLDALAAAHANAGQFDRAIRCQQEAIINVPGDFAQPFRERLALYEQHRPFRNGADDFVDGNVRAASLEAAPHSQR